MISSSDLKRGVLLDMDGAPWEVLDATYQTPSARGASTITKIKIRNLKTGQVLSKSYRGGEMLATADCEKRPCQFLYRQDDEYVFMDQQSYDQFTLTSDALGSAAGFLTEGLEVRSMLYNDQVMTVELPLVVELTVTETAPVVKSSTVQAQPKPATVETGIQIMVPPYLEAGERIRVDTRDGRFIERAKG
ncbi:MAG: elongation factor P [Deltaproteobacteria bacterium]|nr:elongation factor P [Deltaproteobacteria bacterium]